MGLMDEIRKLTHPFSDKEDDVYDEYDDEEETMDEESAPSQGRPSYTTRGAAAAAAAAAQAQAIKGGMRRRLHAACGGHGT